jgi:hypothetical protein
MVAMLLRLNDLVLRSKGRREAQRRAKDEVGRVACLDHRKQTYGKRRVRRRTRLIFPAQLVPVALTRVLATRYH